MNPAPLNTEWRPLPFGHAACRTRSAWLLMLAAALSLAACQDPEPAGPDTTPIAVGDHSLGLWTKADAVTEFDDAVARGIVLSSAPPETRGPADISAPAEKPGKPAQDGRQFCAYVTGFGSEEVCGIVVPSAESIGCIRTGESPHGIALAQDGSRLYVSNEGSNTVSVVDPNAMRIVTTVAVGWRPNQIALTPDGHSLWVTNNADHSVSVVDTASNRVARTIEVGPNPHIVAMSPSRGQALVTSEGDGAVDVFDLETFERVRRIIVYGFPRVLSVAPSGDRAFLTLRWLNGALVLDLGDGSVSDRVSVGERPFAEAGKIAHGIAVTHDGQLVLLTTQPSGELTWIDASNLAALGTVSVGDDPNWVEITPDDRYAIVSNTGDDTAVVIDVRQRRVLGRASVSAQPKRLTVGACPEAAVSSKGAHAP